MNERFPIIDHRSEVFLAEQLRGLLLQYCKKEWGDDLEALKSDKYTDAMIRIFSRMTGRVIESLNRLPEKYFVTFLNMLGVQPVISRAAKTPIVFSPGKESGMYGIVPPRTKVIANSETQEVIFETDKELTVIKPNLIRMVSIDPIGNKWSELDLKNNSEKKSKAIKLFNGEEKINYRIHTELSEFMVFGDNSYLSIESDIKYSNLDWFFIDDDGISHKIKTEGFREDNLKDGVSDNGITEEYDKQTAGFENDYNISSRIEKNIYTKFSTDNSREELESFASKINKINLVYLPDKMLKPDKLLFNDINLNLTREFYPFGQIPKLNDTFYIACKNIFSMSGAAIIINVIPLGRNVYNEGIELVWEYWNGFIWDTIFITTNMRVVDNNFDGADSTKAFTFSDDTQHFVRFKCPKIKPCKVDTEDNYWIRVRIKSGDYGKEEYYKEPIEIIKKVKNVRTIEGSPFFSAGDVLQEFIDKIRKDYDKNTYILGMLPQDCDIIGSLNTIIMDDSFYEKFYKAEKFDDLQLSEPAQLLIKKKLDNPKNFSKNEKERLNRLLLEDCFKEYIPKSDKIVVDEIEIPFLQSIYIGPTLSPPLIKEILIGCSFENKPQKITIENNLDLKELNSIAIESKSSDFNHDKNPNNQKTIYMAFDENIKELPVSLFFDLEANQTVEGDKKPELEWEYFGKQDNKNKWYGLNVDDETNKFTRSGILSFHGPENIVKTSLFGTEHYWIRAILKDGGYIDYPRLNAVYTNVVWAGNSSFVSDEILGTSLGKPEQQFKVEFTPVLESVKVSVRERIDMEEWVEWLEVKTFLHSEPESRHYLIDRETGIITFGDGKNGMIVPIGMENIKCSYIYGGGKKGNIQGGTAMKLWEGLPFIDSVFSPVNAEGGTDQEDYERVKARGPYTLKHPGSTVTCEDIEILVIEAFPQIIAAKCFSTSTNNFTPGQYTLVVVTGSPEYKPVSSIALINEIEEFLYRCVSAYVSSAPNNRINVVMPQYIPVEIHTCLRCNQKYNIAAIENAIGSELKEFFNSLIRGEGNRLMDSALGRSIYDFEIYQIINNIPGVEEITQLSFKVHRLCYCLILKSEAQDNDFYPQAFFNQYDQIESENGCVVFALEKNQGISSMKRYTTITGFREGEKVIISNHGNLQERIIKSIIGDVIEFSNNGNYLFNTGDMIEVKRNKTQTIRSYIKKNISNDKVRICIPGKGDIFYLRSNDDGIRHERFVVKDAKEVILISDNELACYETSNIICEF